MRLYEELSGRIYQIPNWMAESNGITKREMFLMDETEKAFILNFGFDEQLQKSKIVSVAKSRCNVIELEGTLEEFLNEGNV